MVDIQGLTMRFANQLLFEEINLKLDRGNRYGLIGANGAGKSTFLKILSGEVEPSSGNVAIDSGFRVGVLGQDQFAFENFSLKDTVLYGNKRLYDAVKEKEKLYMSAEFTDEINDRLAELELISAEEDPTYEYETRIERILSSLGLLNYDALMSELETSDKFKVLLAQVLFPKPDILFLDEPTNNLDIDAIAWLENELNHHDGTLVVISHDRHFLNRVCTHILDVDFKKIREFSGNYDEWYIAANLIAKREQMQQEKKLKEKEELERFIARFSANASKARQATSRQKRVEKLDIEEIKTSSRREPSIVFRLNREIGNELIELKNINKSFGDKTIYKNFNFKLEKGDKVALIGPNGVGKSTLCKIITGELKPDSGEVFLGATIELGYFPQDSAKVVDGELKLYEFLQDKKNRDLDEIRRCLGRMLFSGAEQEKMAKDLSGGEKHRVMLSKLMLLKPNILVLDEPNNHLDLEAIIALGEGLYNYSGGVICVSHDRELIDAFANRILYIDKSGDIVDFNGSYEEFREKFKENFA